MSLKVARSLATPSCSFLRLNPSKITRQSLVSSVGLRNPSVGGGGFQFDQKRSIARIPFSANNRAEHRQLESEYGFVGPSDAANWQIRVSLLVERFPIVSPPRSQLEEEYVALVNQIEAENSHLSTHEVWERDYEEKTKSGQTPSAVSETGEKLLTPIDYGYNREQEVKAFEEIKPSIITEADKQNDTKSLERALDRKLVCVVRQRFTDPKYMSPWLLPETSVGQEETLRDAATRLSVELFGKPDWVHLMGNAPAACLKYKYAQRLAKKTGMRGSLTFVHRCRLNYQLWADQPDINVKDEFVEHKWMPHDEVLKLIEPSYLPTLRAVLFE